jgi:hypothetical protein
VVVVGPEVVVEPAVVVIVDPGAVVVVVLLWVVKQTHSVIFFLNKTIIFYRINFSEIIFQ